MDLTLLNQEFKKSAEPRWFKVHQSELLLSYSQSSTDAFSHLSNQYVSQEEISRILSDFCVHDWKDVKNPDGSDIPFSKLAAYNGMRLDVNFLKTIVDICFDSSKFCEV